MICTEQGSHRTPTASITPMPCVFDSTVHRSSQRAPTGSRQPMSSHRHVSEPDSGCECASYGSCACDPVEVQGALPLPYLLVILVALGFWVWCVVDFARTDPRDVRTFEPWVWVLLLVLGSFAGGVAWIIGGRPRPGVR